MREIVVWMTRGDGVTHWAAVNDDPCTGRVLRSFCGLESRLPWERLCGPDAAPVTCPDCRREANRNANGVPIAA